MNNNITEFSIRELLSDKKTYIIPMYQRNYSWGEGEINQLIQDVIDYQEAKNKQYYIGTLVTYQRDDEELEVIDGQQRFTTLSLLAICFKNLFQSDTELGEKIKMDWYKRVNIDFENRSNSTNTFKALSEQKQLYNQQKDEKYNQSIFNGYRLIEKELKRLRKSSAKLIDFANYFLDNVKIMRVFVPKGTDLNHYFEVMNNRGEQLEKHEIVKAKMMSCLGQNDKDMHALNKVWEACENIERYVQFGFSQTERSKIFGKTWDSFEVNSFDEFADCLDSVSSHNETNSLKSILSNEFNSDVESQNKKNDKDKLSTQFKNVIDFPNFLLHVLRVCTKKNTSLDDKRLLQQFDEYVLGDEKYSSKRVKEFIFALLKCKYLFDYCVIKHEDVQNEHEWKLKKLRHSEGNSKNNSNYYYVNSFTEDNNDSVSTQLLMLQSAFHVSTPTMSYKHWLNAALYYLYDAKTTEINAKEYLAYLTCIAERFVFDRFLATNGKDYYHMIFEEDKNYRPEKLIDESKLRFNQIENNFVFNYLDYLLWLQDKDKCPLAKNFKFTFRSSVEHFYPQNPMEDHPAMDDFALNHFGNLCLISHSKNSRLSNFSPKAKIDHFTKSINKNSIDSLKLYKMIDLTENDVWDKDKILKHGKEMIDILQNQ